MVVCWFWGWVFCLFWVFCLYDFVKKKLAFFFFFRTVLCKLMTASFGAVKCMDASKKSLGLFFPPFL